MTAGPKNGQKSSRGKTGHLENYRERARLVVLAGEAASFLSSFTDATQRPRSARVVEGQPGGCAAKKMGGTSVLRGSEGICRFTPGPSVCSKRFWERVHFACGPRRGLVLTWDQWCRVSRQNKRVSKLLCVSKLQSWQWQSRLQPAIIPRVPLKSFLQSYTDIRLVFPDFSGGHSKSWRWFFFSLVHFGEHRTTVSKSIVMSRSSTDCHRRHHDDKHPRSSSLCLDSRWRRRGSRKNGVSQVGWVSVSWGEGEGSSGGIFWIIQRWRGERGEGDVTTNNSRVLRFAKCWCSAAHVIWLQQRPRRTGTQTLVSRLGAVTPVCGSVVHEHNFTDKDWWLPSVGRMHNCWTHQTCFFSFGGASEWWLRWHTWTTRRIPQSCARWRFFGRLSVLEQENVALEARRRLQDGDLFRIEVALCRIFPWRHSIVLSHTALFPLVCLSSRWSSWWDATWFPCRHVQVALDNTWHWLGHEGSSQATGVQKRESTRQWECLLISAGDDDDYCSCNCRAEPGNTRRVVKHLCHDSGQMSRPIPGGCPISTCPCDYSDLLIVRSMSLKSDPSSEVISVSRVNYTTISAWKKVSHSVGKLIRNNLIRFSISCSISSHFFTPARQWFSTKYQWLRSKKYVSWM